MCPELRQSIGAVARESLGCPSRSAPHLGQGEVERPLEPESILPPRAARACARHGTWAGVRDLPRGSSPAAGRPAHGASGQPAEPAGTRGTGGIARASPRPASQSDPMAGHHATGMAARGQAASRRIGADQAEAGLGLLYDNDVHALRLEHGLLHRRAAHRVVADEAVAADDPMARDQQRDRVVGQRRADARTARGRPISAAIQA